MSENKLVGIDDLIKEVGKRRGLKCVRYCVWVRPLPVNRRREWVHGVWLGELYH